MNARGKYGSSAADRQLQVVERDMELWTALLNELGYGKSAGNPAKLAAKPAPAKPAGEGPPASAAFGAIPAGVIAPAISPNGELEEKPEERLENDRKAAELRLPDDSAERKDFIDAIEYYTKEDANKEIQGYKKINNCLRRGEWCDDTTRKYIKDIHETLSAQKTKEDITVYRAMPDSAFSKSLFDGSDVSDIPDEKLIGLVSYDRGFPSSSVKVASSIAKDPVKRNILIFNLPKGSAAAYIAPHSEHGENLPEKYNENEVLLDCGQMWRITGVKRAMIEGDEKKLIEKRLIFASIFSKPDVKIRDVFKGSK
jgi:hypothetical protein